MTYDIESDRKIIGAAKTPWAENWSPGDFIAAARTRWPQALDEIERLQRLFNEAIARGVYLARDLKDQMAEVDSHRAWKAAHEEIEADAIRIDAENQALKAENERLAVLDAYEKLLAETARQAGIWDEQHSQQHAVNVRITSENAEHKETLAWLRRKIELLFNHIAHGDDNHRAWLKDAIDKHFAEEPA